MTNDTPAHANRANAPWHCRQIATSSPAPIVVCEREDMQAEIERLRAALKLIQGTASAGNSALWRTVQNIARRALGDNQ